MRRGHPLTGRLTSPRAFAEARHLLATPDGEQRGLVDEALASEGLSRRVVATVPLILLALALLAVGDLVACLPIRIAALFARQFGPQHQALPFATRSFPVSAVFHQRNANSPMHEWIIRRIGALQCRFSPDPLRFTNLSRPGVAQPSLLKGLPHSVLNSDFRSGSHSGSNKRKFWARSLPEARSRLHSGPPCLIALGDPHGLQHFAAH